MRARTRTSLLLTAIAISGCSVAGNGGGSGGGVTPKPPIKAGSAEASSLSASQVLSAYQQTFATPSFNLAAAKKAGIQGYGVGTTVPTAAAETSSFKTATIKISEDQSTLTITIDGKSHDLKVIDEEGGITIGGKSYVAHAYTPSGKQDVAIALSGTYASLTGYVENTNMRTISHEADGFAFIVTGGETDPNKIPKQILNYNGEWFLVSETGYSDGTFTSAADFTKNQLTWNAFDGKDVNTGNGVATISGNRFTGKADISMAGMSGNADIVGAFYGPAAEEIAGVVGGSVSKGSTTEQVGGAFFGAKTP